MDCLFRLSAKSFKSTSTMAPSVLSVVLSGSALVAAVNAQAYAGGDRSGDAFQYIQPLNTTILTEYGSSPPVYPSREFSSSSQLVLGRV